MENQNFAELEWEKKGFGGFGKVDDSLPFFITGCLLDGEGNNFEFISNKKSHENLLKLRKSKKFGAFFQANSWHEKGGKYHTN